MKFLYVMGQNPAVTSPNLEIVYEALSKLDMLVVADLFNDRNSSLLGKDGGRIR